jgi:hypothetical protein
VALPLACFRKLVKQAQLPKPRVIAEHRIFDIEDLDRALDELPYEGSHTRGGNKEPDTWADYE